MLFVLVEIPPQLPQAHCWVIKRIFFVTTHEVSATTHSGVRSDWFLTSTGIIF